MPRWIQRVWDRIDTISDAFTDPIYRTAPPIPLWLSFAVAVAIGLGAGVALMKVRRNAADVAVVVNGDTITGKEFHHRLEVIAGPQALETLLSERLLVQYAREHGIVASPADVDARVLSRISSPAYLKNVRDHHLTPDDIQDGAKRSLLNERLFAGSAPVSDADIREVYRKETDALNPHAALIRPQTMAVHIIAGSSELAVRAAWNEIQKGAAFEKIAQKYHGSPQFLKSKVIPHLTPDRAEIRDSSSFEARLFSLKPGETLGPTRYRGGWWIVRCNAKRAAEVPPLERVWEQCRAAAQAAKGGVAKATLTQVDLDLYRKTAPVQIYWQRYRNLVNAATTTLSRN